MKKILALLVILLFFACSKAKIRSKLDLTAHIDTSIEGGLFSNRHLKYMYPQNESVFALETRKLAGKCGERAGTYKFCNYEDPFSKTLVQYWLCLEGANAECPKTIPNVVSVFQVYNFKASDEFFACTECRKMGVYCDRDGDCCQTYPVDGPKGQNALLPSVFLSHCYKDKQFRGTCRPCLQLHAACGNGKVSCCDQQDNPLTSVISCNRQNAATDLLPQLYAACGVKACNPKEQLTNQYFHRSCYTYLNSKKLLPNTYFGRNFCDCPKDAKTGYKCYYDDCHKGEHGKCVTCGLDGHACTSAKDCCDFHLCAENKKKKKVCGRMKCSPQGRPCKKDSDCCEKDLTCQQGFGGTYCTKYKCKQIGDYCGNDPDCCGEGVCRNIVKLFGRCFKKGTCSKEGERCTETEDCCGDNLACSQRNKVGFGKCQTCFKGGALCRNDADCCSQFELTCADRKDTVVDGETVQMGICKVECSTENVSCTSTRRCCKPLRCKDERGEILKPYKDFLGNYRIGQCIPV